MKAAIAVVLVLSLVITSGCATLIRGATQEVSVTSVPEGAKVSVGEVSYGNTPSTLKLKPKDEPVITVEKAGVGKQSIQTTASVGGGWVFLAILTFPIGLIVDAVSGAWYGFDTRDYVVDLKAQKTITPENTNPIK